MPKPNVGPSKGFDFNKFKSMIPSLMSDVAGRMNPQTMGGMGARGLIQSIPIFMSNMNKRKQKQPAGPIGSPNVSFAPPNLNVGPSPNVFQPKYGGITGGRVSPQVMPGPGLGPGMVPTDIKSTSNPGVGLASGGLWNMYNQLSSAGNSGMAAQPFRRQLFY